MTTATLDTRQFSVSPHIIYSLIKAQAGSLAKGVLECIMNSVDAGAKNIDIVLNNRTLTVSDDGKGFRTRAEIEACFEVFGFEHHEGDRSYGQFGIGRAQLWNFCSTVWHTNDFRMDVDIKNRGLDYDLVGNVGPVTGLRIEGTFYEPMTSADVLSCERELKELAMYVHIPVTFNGERISQDPADRKWTYETDDAWISLSSVSRSLTVYNLGVKVKDYSSYHVGTGGLVVTKPGVRLSLNMARNDVLIAECKVWKRIKPFLQGKTDEVVKKASRLTEEQMANLATRFLSNDMPYANIANRKLIRDVVGGNHTLAEFYDRAWGTFDHVVTFAPKNEAGPAAEESHKQGYCFVLAQKTLQRFSVSTVEEFMRKVEAQLCAEGEDSMVLRDKTKDGKLSVERLNTEESWLKACSQIADGCTDIPHKDWTKPEQAALSALRISSMTVLRILKQIGLVGDDTKLRELRVGVSEVAYAWTDGVNTITFNRTELAHLDKGTSGALHVISALVHEYLHEGPTSGTHVHDEEFYERYHTALTYFPAANTWGQSVGDVVSRLLVDYMKECSKRKVHVKTRVQQNSSSAEAYGIMDMADAA